MTSHNIKATHADLAAVGYSIGKNSLLSGSFTLTNQNSDSNIDRHFTGVFQVKATKETFQILVMGVIPILNSLCQHALCNASVISKGTLEVVCTVSISEQKNALK